MRMDPALSELLDRQAMFDVMIRYGTSVDARDLDRYRTCFVDDVTVVGFLPETIEDERRSTDAQLFVAPPAGNKAAEGLLETVLHGAPPFSTRSRTFGFRISQLESSWL